MGTKQFILESESNTLNQTCYGAGTGCRKFGFGYAGFGCAICWKFPSHYINQDFSVQFMQEFVTKSDF